MTETNPFLSMPFPGAGGAYRVDGKKLKREGAAPAADADASATDKPAAAPNPTNPPASRRTARKE